MYRQTNRSGKTILPVGLIVLFDFLIFAAALVVFALFHHVLPKSMVKTPQVISSNQGPIVTDINQTENNVEAQTSQYPIGDFSATFPNYDTTDANAIKSYQTDDVRISLKKSKVGDAVAFIADIYVRDIKYLSSAFAKGQAGQGYTESVLNMSASVDSILSINGDYYGSRARGVVIRNGILYRDSAYDDVCVIYEDGVMETFTSAEFDINEAIAKKAWQAWSFGPMLLDHGKAMSTFNSSVVPANPRTVIGYYAPGHYCFIVVDGRQSGYSNGMHMKTLSQFVADLGCVTAYNLDGGQSSMMAYDGEIVNQPYDGGRSSSDIIYIGR